MSATPGHSASSDAFAQLLRGCVLPTVVVGLAATAIGFASGPKAGWSAAFGAALVIAFFSLTLLVMRRTADLAPTTTMLIVLVTYTLKVVVLGAAMFLLRDAAWLSGFAVGVSITMTAIVWLFLELRAYQRLRIFVYDPTGDAALEAEPGRGPRDGS